MNSVLLDVIFNESPSYFLLLLMQIQIILLTIEVFKRR